MLNFAFGSNGKNKLILAAIYFVVAAVIFIFYDDLKDYRGTIMGVEVLQWLFSFGRFGFSGFLAFGGVLFGVWGILQLTGNKQNDLGLRESLENKINKGK